MVNIQLSTLQEKICPVHWEPLMCTLAWIHKGLLGKFVNGYQHLEKYNILVVLMNIMKNLVYDIYVVLWLNHPYGSILNILSPLPIQRFLWVDNIFLTIGSRAEITLPSERIWFTNPISNFMLCEPLLLCLKKVSLFVHFVNLVSFS